MGAVESQDEDVFKKIIYCSPDEQQASQRSRYG